MARGVDLLVAQIAIAKTGAAWLPFDADAPVERIAVCLQDAEAKALLTSQAFAQKMHGASPCDVLVAAEIVDSTDSRPVDARALGATPDHPAYLIYTSGSTGTPKGIVITGRNICHFLRAANEIYQLHSTDIVFQGASVAFDLSMEEIWLPYLVGATLFVATPEMMGEAEKLPDVMEANGITVLDTVPTLLAMMPRDIPSLRVIILGGEACPADRRESLVPSRTQYLQFLRSDGSDRCRDRRGGAAARAGDDRQADPELHLLHRRRAASAARAWCRGRIADRRARRRAGLSQTR